MKKDDSIDLIFYLGPIVKCITRSLLALWGFAIIPWLITKSWFFWDWGWYWALFYLVTSMIPILGFVEDFLWDAYKDKNCNLKTFRRDHNKVKEVFDMPDKIHKKIEPAYNFLFFLGFGFSFLSGMISYFYTLPVYLCDHEWRWAFWEIEGCGNFLKIIFVVVIFFVAILSYLAVYGVIVSKDETDESDEIDENIKQ